MAYRELSNADLCSNERNALELLVCLPLSEPPTARRLEEFSALTLATQSANFFAHAVKTAHREWLLSKPLDLSRRERQIVEELYRLGEASVAEVQAAMSDPPSYSSVRAMLTELVRKKQIVFRRDGKRYVYRPRKSRENVRSGLLRQLVKNFFAGKPSDAICALIDQEGKKLSAEDIARIRRQIAQFEEAQK